MRFPIMAQIGNLLWTRAGTVWAVWRLSPLDYGFRSADAKRSVRTAHTALFRALTGESLLMGLCAQLDADTVVERMAAGIDLSRHPAWAAECDALRESLRHLPLGERSFWLAVPLPTIGRARFTDPVRAAVADFAETMALPRTVVSRQQVEGWLKASDELVRNRVPPMFEPRPATAAEMMWLSAHVRFRGLIDHPVPEGTDPRLTDDLVQRGGASLDHLLLDEGGQTDVERGGWRRVSPFRRRFLKITDAGMVGEDLPSSYQCMLVLDDVPPGGMLFPGSEYLGRIDECGVDVDWAVRLHIQTGHESARRIRRAVRDLKDQYQQRSGELSTGHHALDRAAQDLASYEEALTNDRSEVSVEATVMFTVSSASAEIAQQRAVLLARHLAETDYRLCQPLGAQEALWWAGQPGIPARPVVRQLAQVTTASAFAASIPLAGTDVGDAQGIPIGLNISSLRPSVVHLDLEATVHDQEASPALAIAGSLGAGKSVALKTLAGATVDRGGRLLTVDRTQSGEWARLAAAITEASVVDVLNPTVSLDPIRLLPGAHGARVAQSFLTALLNVQATSPEGRLLSDVLDAGYLRANGIGSLGRLTDHLAAGDLGHRELASYLRTFARKDLGRVIFDDSLPALRLTSRAIVFGTAGLQLPSREELIHEHLFKQMRLERIFGRAFYALIMGLIRWVAFQDPSELVIIPLDEAHHVTSSPESENEIVELIRDGRKHKAAVALGSHDPIADFGGPTLRGLIPTRFVGRQSDEPMARRSLEWLGLDPDDQELVSLLTKYTSPVDEATGTIPEHRRGEVLMHDSRGRIARVKILAPAQSTRAKAVLTTPPRHQESVSVTK